MSLYKKLDLNEVAKKARHYLDVFKKRSSSMTKGLKTKIEKIPKATLLAVAVIATTGVVGSAVYYSGIINPTIVQEEVPITIPSVIPENPEVLSSPSYPGNRHEESSFHENISENNFTEMDATTMTTAISLINPVQGRVIREFGFNYSSTFRDYRFHGGIDIEVSQGASVVAVADGEVTGVLHNEIEGYTIILEHRPDLQTHYRHLTEISVVHGENVRQGQEIGRITEADIYLHFGITYRDNKEDPQRHLEQ